MLPSEIKKGEKKKEEAFPWTKEQEDLLAEWAEKAMCYRWLHGRSEKSYRVKNYTFTIPVIILSTLTGTANFAMDSFVPEEYKQVAMAGVGSVNIFAGILSTLQNFLRYAELMESHRLSEVQWSKFGRNIEVELALDPRRRKPAHEFLEVCRAEYDRLIEQSPTIDDNIIKQFKSNFKNLEIKVPPMCNGLDKIKIFTPSPEEKLENVMTHVTSKLLQSKKPRKWTVNDIPTLPVKRDTRDTSLSQKPSSPSSETKKDLEELKSFSRVSALKQKQTQGDADNSSNPRDEIHRLLKQKMPDPSEFKSKGATEEALAEAEAETEAEAEAEEALAEEALAEAEAETEEALAETEAETGAEAGANVDIENPETQTFLKGIEDA